MNVPNVRCFFGYIRPSRNLSIDTALGETRDSVAERTRMEAVKACEDVVLGGKTMGWMTFGDRWMTTWRFLFVCFGCFG